MQTICCSQRCNVAFGSSVGICYCWHVLPQSDERCRSALITCELSHWQTKVNALRVLRQKFQTKEYPAFEDALEAFCAEAAVVQRPFQSAALACAGPVLNNACEMTNLKWTIDGAKLTSNYNTRSSVFCRHSHHYVYLFLFDSGK